jgi:beta-lactamase class A
MTVPLATEARAIALDAELEAGAIAVHLFGGCRGDQATGGEGDARWHVNGDRWFHAASTIKVAILMALGAAVAEGRLALVERLAVRNSFRSAADGSAFRISPGRDADKDVHKHIGRTMRLEELAFHMVTTSSNLATNLLLDLIGVDYARACLDRLGIDGIDLRRGVEDDRAFEAGLNNRVTANGLVQLFRSIHDGQAASPAISAWIIDVLAQQQFSSGIPAGLPEEVRGRAKVAHKTGEISNMAHDAGLVFLDEGIVYAIAVLTETKPGVTPRQHTVARLARAAYEQVMATAPGETAPRV